MALVRGVVTAEEHSLRNLRHLRHLRHVFWTPRECRPGGPEMMLARQEPLGT